MASNRSQQQELLKVFTAYNRRLILLYNEYIKKLTELASKKNFDIWDKLKDNPLFNFDNYPELNGSLDKIFNDYIQDNMLCYKAGITDGVNLAYSQDNINIGKYTILQDKALQIARNTAATTFIKDRLQRNNGLSLSDKIWNYARQGKSELETGLSCVISDGLKNGTSASELGRLIRFYLNNSDMMYRRYHRIVVDNSGHKKDIVRWRRRQVDKKGNVHFIEEPLEKVGMGTYRSSCKNSERLMRTEINTAYHKANSNRWQGEPFVYGMRIWLSPEHPATDICDELEGYYPKDFMFTGWHPQCMCASAPLTLYGEEKENFYKRLMNGENMSNFHSKYEIKEPPKAWSSYIDKQHGSILKAGKNGKLAYHLADNTKYWQNSFSVSEQKQMGLKIEDKK